MKEENYDIIYSFEKTNWWYRAKKDLFEQILKKTKRKFGATLDIGCGVGSNFEILKKFSGKVVGIDNSQRALDYCKKKSYHELYKKDAGNLNFKDNSFDLILCSDVLEHIDDKKAIKQIKRILKPGGILIVSVPAHNYLWGPTDNISRHLRRYEFSELKSLLKEFKIIKFSYWNFLMFSPNLVFINLLSLAKKNKQEKNSLEFIPKFLDSLLYYLLVLENRFFIKFNILQGVSLVAVAEKAQ